MLPCVKLCFTKTSSFASGDNNGWTGSASQERTRNGRKHRFDDAIPAACPENQQIMSLSL
jgi:hypothetical protein